MNKLELKVEGMVCTGCENRLKNAILQMKNVKNVEASFMEKKVIVEFVKNIDKTKFDITVLTVVKTGVYVEEVEKYCTLISMLPEYEKLTNPIAKMKYKVDYKKIYKEDCEKIYKKYVKNEYDVEIVWTANVPEFIMLGDELLTPFEKTDVRLKCVLKYGTESTTLFYEIYNVGGQITKEEYLQKILDYYCKIELKGSINHLHKEYNDELYLDYQERINSYGVLNLFKTVKPVVNQSYLIDVTRNDFIARFFGSGTLGTVYKPSVSQAILNERFYKGYQMPNTQNVLWIVVHESAMTVDGQTAEYLAKMQYRYAFETGGREASWNYQVDAYGIYQSFADNVICWHASDGTVTPGTGNNNGIGIEMCVNQDGNYEGTLANNAKLVASLMLKYNLNLDNVKRHHDMDPKGKECPSYLIRTGRYEEFVEMIRMEYILQKYFSDAEVNFELSTDEYNNTEDVLKNLFREGINGLYYNLPVEVEKHVNFKVIAKISDKVYESNSTIKLLPDRKEEDNA